MIAREIENAVNGVWFTGSLPITGAPYWMLRFRWIFEIDMLEEVERDA